MWDGRAATITISPTEIYIDILQMSNIGFCQADKYRLTNSFLKLIFISLWYMLVDIKYRIYMYMYLMLYMLSVKHVAERVCGTIQPE